MAGLFYCAEKNQNNGWISSLTGIQTVFKTLIK
jgi:hypothetical protein